MFLTVKDYLNTGYMEKSAIIAGKRGLNRYISKITVLDSVDGIEFIKGKEFILANTYAFSSAEEMRDIIKKLNNAGASCMAFKNRFANGCPESVISIAEKLGFPLISIPIDFTWAETIDTFYNSLFEYQYGIISYKDNVHNTFNKMVLSNAPISEMCEKLNEIINKPILIINDFNEILAKVGISFNKNFDKERLLKIIKSVRNKSNNQNLHEEFIGSYKAHIKLIDVNLYYNAPIFFIVLSKTNNNIDKLEMNALEYAITVITLQLIKEKQTEETEMRLFGNFFNNLLFGSQEIDNKNLLRKAKHVLNYHQNQEFVIFIIDIDNFGLYVEKEKPTEEAILSTKVKVERAIKSFFTGIYRKPYISTDDDSFIIYYPEPENNLFQIINNLKKEISKKIQHFTFSVGVSERHNNLNNINNSYHEALTALSIGRKTWGKNKIFFYDKLGLYLFISKCNSDNALVDHIKNKYKNLIEIDKSKSGIYLDTLNVYFRENMNIKKTANAMFLHPKTIKYRLDKISKVAGTDLNNQEERLQFELLTKMITLDRGNI